MYGPRPTPTSFRILEHELWLCTYHGPLQYILTTRALCVLPFGYLNRFGVVSSLFQVRVCPSISGGVPINPKGIRGISAIASSLHCILLLTGATSTCYEGWPWRIYGVDEWVDFLPVVRYGVSYPLSCQCLQSGEQTQPVALPTQCNQKPCVLLYFPPLHTVSNMDYVLYLSYIEMRFSIHCRREPRLGKN